MTLTCSAKGRPVPTLTWFRKEDSKPVTGATGKMGAVQITSIKESQNGEYYCKAENKHGTINSSSVMIDVTCEYFSWFYCINLILCVCESAVLFTFCYGVCKKKKKHLQYSILSGLLL